MDQQQDWLNQQLADQNRRMSEQQKILSLLVNQINELQPQGNPSPSNSHEHDSSRNSFHFNPKLDFPIFEGTNPRNWIRKCKNFVKYLIHKDWT